MRRVCLKNVSPCTTVKITSCREYTSCLGVTGGWLVAGSYRQANQKFFLCFLSCVNYGGFEQLYFVPFRVTGTTIAGFPPGQSTGMQALNDDAAAKAQACALKGYNTLLAMVPTRNITGLNLGGMKLKHGVYLMTYDAALNGTLTLDAEGDSTVVFVFQVCSFRVFVVQWCDG